MSEERKNGTGAETPSAERENRQKRRPRKRHLMEREELISMPYLIQTHFMDPILKAINFGLRDGSLERIVYRKIPLENAARGNIRVDRFAFWRLNRTDVLADLDVQLSFEVREGGEEAREAVHLWMTLWFSFGTQGVSMEVETVERARDSFERPLIRLSSYLVPILRLDEIDRACEDLWKRYLPDKELNPKKGRANDLARAMGLQVMEVRQLPKQSLYSVLCFSKTEVPAIEEGRHGKPEEGETLPVEPNTILVNLGAGHGEERELDVWHECFHYEFHLPFFRLQNLKSTDTGEIRKRKILAEEVHSNGCVSRMEFQAWWGSYALMMPQGFIKPVLEEEMEKAHKEIHAGGYEKHEGFLYSCAIRAIAEKYLLSKARIRTRLLLLKFAGVKGALNWADGHYVRAFAFLLENCRSGQTFTIDRDGVWKLYKQDKVFRNMMQSGQFVYVDGHVCIHDEKYIVRYNHRMELSPWANAHVDQVCLRFNQKFIGNRAEYSYGGGTDMVREYSNFYNGFLDTDGKLNGQAILEARADYIEKMPGTFSGALNYVRKGKMTVQELSVESHVASSTIAHWISKEQRQYDVDKVVAVCIALHLPPWVSQELLKRANLAVKRIGKFGHYGILLDCFFMDTVDEVQEFLENHGLPKLKVSE